MTIAIDEPATVSLTPDGEARFATSKFVVWTSSEHVYVAAIGETGFGDDPQRDFAPNVADALRWLAPILLEGP